jgi:hypothetical protein
MQQARFKPAGQEIIELQEGSLKAACSVSDALVLQYYEEADPIKAAFGYALSAEACELPGAIEAGTPIGCKLVLCRWRGPDGEAYVSADLVYQTVDQLRNTPLLDLDRHPAAAPLRFAAISPNADGLFRAQDFLDLLRDSIEEYDRITEEYELADAA